MNCSFCGNKTRVMDSRPKDENTIWRRRLCDSCSMTFSTYETIRPAIVVLSEEKLAEVTALLRKKNGIRGVDRYVIAELTQVPVDVVLQLAREMEVKVRPVTARS